MQPRVGYEYFSRLKYYQILSCTACLADTSVKCKIIQWECIVEKIIINMKNKC